MSFGKHIFDGRNQLNCVVVFAAPCVFGEHIGAVKQRDADPFGGSVD
jgi:hypothetical protein